VSKIFIGNVTPEGDGLIHRYLEKFVPDAVVEPLKQAGIRATMKNRASKPDVLLVIIDEALYSTCEGVCKDVLALPKVHKYVNDAGLKEFLISKFGIIEGIEQEMPVVDEEPEVIQSVDNEMPVILEDTSSNDLELEKLQKELNRSRSLIVNLERQLKDSGGDSDIPALVERIRTLEKELEIKDNEVKRVTNESYMALGKITKAEESITELENTKRDLQLQREHNAQAEFEKANLAKTVSELSGKVKELEQYPSMLEDTKNEVAIANKKYQEAYAQYESKCDEYEVLQCKVVSLESEISKKEKEIGGIRSDLDKERQNNTISSAKREEELTLLNKKLSDKDIELEQLRLQLESSAKVVSSKESELKTLQDRVDSLLSKIEDLQLKHKEAIESKEAELESTRTLLTEEKSHVSELQDSIKVLEVKYADIESKLESSNTSLDVERNARTEQVGVINSLKEKVETLENEKEVLSSEINSKKKALEDKVALIQSLELDKKELTSQVSGIEKTLEEERNVVASLKSDLSGKNSMVQSLELDKKELTSQVSGIEKMLSEEKNESLVLKSGLSERDTKIQSLELGKKELESKLGGIEEQLSSEKKVTESLRNEISALNSKIEHEKQSASELDSNIKQLEREKHGIEDELSLARKDVSSMTLKISDLELELGQTKGRLSNLESQLSTAKGTIADLKHELEVKEVDLMEANSHSGEVESLTKRLTSATDSIAKLREAEEERNTLTKEVHSLREELVTKSEAYVKERGERLELEQASERTRLELQNNINDKEREIENLRSEIELLKRGEEKDGKTADLRLKIIELQEELQDLKSEGDKKDSEELLKVRKELTEARERCTSLEMDIIDKDEQLSEIQGNIFTQMLNNAGFKYPIKTDLMVSDTELRNIKVVVGGSAESTMQIYQTLKNTCTSHPDKHFIIIDITTDSYMDSEFKVTKFTSPIPWLQGSEKINGFLLNTAFKGVKVVSTALVYYNPLALLLVDWNARLRELQGLADTIYINVGTLDNIVSRILFYSFAKVMDGHVIVKASATNLRTTLVTLAGFKDIEVEVDCINMGVLNSSAKAIYQKISSTYKAKYLKENEGLEV